jgi:hypothetical protein
MSRLSTRLTLFIAIAAGIGLQIYLWGGPIRPVYRIVEAPAGTLGAATQWTIVRAGRNPERWIATDTNGDGTWDEFTTPGGTFVRPGLGTPPARWLVVCLDGMPLAAMQALWDRGHFREFFRPSATISTLPSDTETALTEVLHAPPVPGYEHRYFDREANRLRGGVAVTLTGSGIPYIRALDYDAPGWAKILPYVLPRKTYLADVGRFRVRFLASSAPVFVAHIASSDALLHVETMKEFEPLLAEFEKVLSELYLDARGTLGVIVFSDHGNTLTLSQPAPVETLLAAHGWRIRGSVDGPRDVAIPAYGLVGFAAIYCRPAAIDSLAEDLRALDGADVIVSRHPVSNADPQPNRRPGIDAAIDGELTATIRTAGSHATADLTWSSDGKRYKYETREGDPLGLTPVFAALRAAGKLDEAGFARDADLFAATSLALLPDSAARIRLWATNHVRNRADIVVSLKPGYYHGAASLGHAVDLAGTHGGLETSASLGFAMATYPLAPATRLGDLIPANLLAHQVN